MQFRTDAHFFVFTDFENRLVYYHFYTNRCYVFFLNAEHRLVCYEYWGDFVHELTYFFQAVSERKLVGFKLMLQHKKLGKFEFSVDWKDGKPFVRELEEATCKTIENKREAVLTIDGIEYV